MDEDTPGKVAGLVKWFDPAKGFGFVVPDGGGADILLHANVLRNFGQGSVADGSAVLLVVQRTPRGMQAIEVLSIAPPAGAQAAPAPDPAVAAAEQMLDEMPFEPGRVKWFDGAKGFGFANVFGRAEDVFIHAEILRRSGLADLQPGEAVAMRVVEGQRGRMAAQVAAWDSVLKAKED